MAGHIRELAEFIEDQSTLVVGTDLYTGIFPQDAADTASAIRPTGGPEEFFVNIRHATHQVISRARYWKDAEDEAFKVYDVLHKARGFTLPVVESGPTYILETGRAIAQPQFIGHDDKGRLEFSTNYLLTVQEQ